MHATSLHSCPTLCDPMDCSLPGSSVHGILQARLLEWVAMPSSGGCSRPRDQTCISSVSCTGRWVLYYSCHLGSPFYYPVSSEFTCRGPGKDEKSLPGWTLPRSFNRTAERDFPSGEWIGLMLPTEEYQLRSLGCGSKISHTLTKPEGCNYWAHML